MTPGKTLAEILTAARVDMEYQDAVEDWIAGRPVRLSHPRRDLRRWLRRRNEPMVALITTEAR